MRKWSPYCSVMIWKTRLRSWLLMVPTLSCVWTNVNWQSTIPSLMHKLSANLSVNVIRPSYWSEPRLSAAIWAPDYLPGWLPASRPTVQAWTFRPKMICWWPVRLSVVTWWLRSFVKNIARKCLLSGREWCVQNPKIRHGGGRLKIWKSVSTRRNSELKFWKRWKNRKPGST